MTLNDYLEHYIANKALIIYLLIALLGLCISICIILLSSALIASSIPTREKKSFYYNKVNNLVERYYEMLFSATSILSFLSTYYLIDRFITQGPFRSFWDKHSDMLLLVMIIISCIVNTVFDKILIRLHYIDHEQKASIRLIGMLYIILIFIYIKFIYENNNYDRFISYFIGLMVGRFAYFDSSFSDFYRSIKAAFKNLPLLVLGLLYTSLMCYIGFKSEYLLISNGVLVSTFIAHLFMVMSIAIIYHSKILSLIVRKPAPKKINKDRDNSSYLYESSAEDTDSETQTQY